MSNMMACCANPLRYAAIPISPEEDEQLRDLFLDEKQQKEEEKNPNINTPIPELRDLLQDFYNINDQYLLSGEVEPRKYQPGELSMTVQTTNDSSVFSDHRMEEPRFQDSMAMSENDALVRDKSNVTGKTDVTDVIPAEKLSPEKLRKLPIEEPQMKENASVFLNMPIEEVKAEDSSANNAEDIEKKDVDVFEESPRVNASEEEKAKAPQPIKSEIVEKRAEEIEILDKSELLKKHEEIKPEVELPTAKLDEKVEDAKEHDNAVIELPIVQEDKQIDAEVKQTELPKQEEVKKLAEPVAKEIEKAESTEQKKQEIKDSSLEEKTEKAEVIKDKKQEESEKKVEKNRLPDYKPVELPQIESQEKPLLIEEEQKKEVNNLLLSNGEPKEPSKLAISSYVDKKNILKNLSTIEIKKTEFEIRTGSSINNSLKISDVSLKEKQSNDLQREEENAKSENNAIVKDEAPVESTPVSAKEKMEQMLKSLENSVNSRESPNFDDSKLSSMVRSGMMHEIPEKEEEIIDNVELYATPSQIIGYYQRKELFKIPLFRNRIHINDQKLVITLLSDQKRYILKSQTEAEYEYRKQKIAEVLDIESFNNTKQPIFRIEIEGNYMQIVEDGQTTRLRFDEIEYDAFKGDLGFIKMYARGRRFTYRGNDEEIVKLLDKLQNGGAEMTMLESSITKSIEK